MKKRDVEINALAEQNVATFMEDGPRLTTKYNVWVDARDRARRKVLLGGLGACGVGRMWCEEEGHENYPGFADAPEMISE